jgi:hypothetical protein
MTPLRQRMIEDMRIRNLARLTQTAYVEHVLRFACYFGKSPEQLGPGEIRSWLIHLTQDKRQAANSIGVTVAALRFLYSVTLKRPSPSFRTSKPPVRSWVKRLSCVSSVVSAFDDPTRTAVPQGWRVAPPPSAASALTHRGPCQAGF